MHGRVVIAKGRWVLKTLKRFALAFAVLIAAASLSPQVAQIGWNYWLGVPLNYGGIGYPWAEVPLSGQVTNYFVDNSCPNNGNGTSSSCAASNGATGAWNNLANARGIAGNACNAGDTIRIKKGTGVYITTNQGGDPSETGGFFITCTAGTQANPYNITADNQADPPWIANCALGSPDYSSCPRPTFTCVSNQWTTISFLKIQGGIWCQGGATTVEANLPRGLVIHHNEMTVGWGEVGDGNWSPIFCQGRFGTWIHHNYMHGIFVQAGGGQQSSTASVKFFTCTNSTIEFNTVDGLTSQATQSGCFDDKQDAINNLFQFNLCINVPHGFRHSNQTNATFPYLSPAHGDLVQFNVFDVVPNSGGGNNCLRLEATANASTAFTDFTFRNNTCVGSFFGDGAVHDNANTMPWSGLKFYNNIIMGSQHHVAFYSSHTFQQMDYNIWDSATSNAFTIASSQYGNLAAVVLGTPFEDHGQSVTVSQVQFVNAGAKNYQIGPTSVAQGTCRTDGTQNGSPIDCGAYTDTVTCLGWTCGGTGPPPDTTPPTCTITVPTNATTFTTNTSPLPTFAGTSSDANGVSSVTWSNNRGGAGTATGTTSWSQANITLQTGDNILTATCTDTSNNQASDSLTVTYTVVTPPTPPAAGGGPRTGVRIR